MSAASRAAWSDFDVGLDAQLGDLTMLDDAVDRSLEHAGLLITSWDLVGWRAARVVVRGELDLATAPQLAESLSAAVAEAPLVVLFLQDVTFLDLAGVQVIRAAVSEARHLGGRLVLAAAPARVAALLGSVGLGEGVDVVASPVAPSAERTVLRAARPRAPLDNPVNAQVLAARVMAVEDDRLWLQTDDGAIRQAWAPAPIGEVASTGRPMELYLDAGGAVNGWCDVLSDLAVNQRGLRAGSAPAVGHPMVCQGRCGIAWQAPAATVLAERGERCLTCAGPLVPG